MFKLLGTAIAVCGFGIAGANAGMITDIEGSNVAGERDFKDWGGFVQREHDLGDNDAANLFVPGSGITILSGTLTVNVWNDTDPLLSEADGLFDSILYDLGDGEQGSIQVNNSSAPWGSLVFTNLVGDTAIGTFNADGGIVFDIYGDGDYYIGETKFKLVTSDARASVPEPGVLVLLGLGLVGLSVARPKIG